MFTSKVCFMKIDGNIFEVRTKSAAKQVFGDTRKQGSKTDKQANGFGRQKAEKLSSELLRFFE